MTSGVVLVVLFLMLLGALAVATVVVAVRGGRGPGDPPASHRHVDPGGFFVLSRPHGVFERPARRRSVRVVGAVPRAVAARVRRVPEPFPRAAGRGAGRRVPHRP